MKKILYIFIALIGMVCTPALACESNQIDVAGDGSNCVDSKFEVTTTSLSAGDVFTFFLSPKGTFYIDCGDDGVLSEESPYASEPQTTITGPKTVVRTSADTDKPTYYTCTYSTGGVKHIRFAGRATEHCSGYALMSTIRFVTTDYEGNTVTHTPTGNLVASISGSLGQIFPVIGSGGSQRSTPRFYQTFIGTSITSIPDNLFDGIRGCGGYMFYGTFGGTPITSIPEHLFDGIICPGSNSFRGTFTSTQITSIPEGLLKNIAYSPNTSTTYLNQMFYRMFYGNQNLTGFIPPALFGDLNNSGLYGNNTMDSTFGSTPNLDTTCPSGTEQYITGYEQYFSGHVACKKTGPITCAAGEYLPKYFNNCIACDSDHTCSGGVFYFDDTTDQGSLNNVVTCESGYFLPANSRQCAACPDGVTCAGGTYRFDETHSSGLTYPNPITNNQTNSCSVGYDNMVARLTPIQYTCNRGEYLPANSLGCITCPSNYYCVGGAYAFNENVTQGIIACDVDLFAPAGSWESQQCGRILHIGNKRLYLRATKQTIPSLNVDIDNDGVADYFANMTTNPVPMNADYAELQSDNHLVINITEPYMSGETQVPAGLYYVYDDTAFSTQPYVKLNYIESSGAQWINTGLSGDTRWVGKAGANANTTKSQVVLLGRTDGAAATFVGSVSSGNIWTLGGALDTNIPITTVTEFDLTYSTINNKTNVSGTIGSTSVDRTSANNILLGDWSICSRNSSYPFAGKLYYFRAYQNGNLVRDFVPVARMSDGAVGMYDTVNQVFYTNAGTGTFTAGPVASNQSF